MIDLDLPTTTDEQKARGHRVWNSIRYVCDPSQRYEIKEKYIKIVSIKGKCVHYDMPLQVMFLEMPDGSGALTAMSAAKMEDLKKTKCEECYIKEFANYTEMHGFPIFTEGTIEQIRYANKVRAKAHMTHGELVDRAISFISEPTWWLDNSSRSRHAKIWREVNEMKDEDLVKMNNEEKMKREILEEKRVNRMKRTMKQ